MCLTNNDDLNQRMRILRDHGMSSLLNLMLYIR